jgi:hypothetical protein
MQPPPNNLSPSVANLLLGVAAVQGGIVRVLDVNAILDADALKTLRAADAS